MTVYPCIVCNKPYDGTTHCSVMACRACAMFFKRCESSETFPTCKRKNNNCIPDYSGRFSCTICRYQRCIQIGMKRQENVRSLTSSNNKQLCPVNTNFIVNIDLRYLAHETMPTLKRFCYHYAMHANNQKAQELLMLYEDGEELIDMPGNKMVCTEVMFADMNDIDSFLDPQTLPDPMDNKTIKDYFKSSWPQYLKTTLPVMHRIKLTDVEFLAVSALILWEEENFNQKPHLKKMAEAHRRMVYKDLDYYYKNILHMDNYIERIMNIQELIKRLKRNLFAMTESVHFLKAFNFYKSNQAMWKATEKIVGILEERS